ncbi:DUF4430 domain-containing protein [Oceanobacillus halotolerans]|uniref:DUF4430 domain-containing protein n=1 Tax=Oceanobacillus halotolerans TaxID=2663380 RepID=UPI0013DCB46E|nr:DUF4430 domain-containing protein [Oceanobacillus halotolerans]
MYTQLRNSLVIMIAILFIIFTVGCAKDDVTPQAEKVDSSSKHSEVTDIDLEEKDIPDHEKSDKNNSENEEKKDLEVSNENDETSQDNNVTSEFNDKQTTDSDEIKNNQANSIEKNESSKKENASKSGTTEKSSTKKEQTNSSKENKTTDNNDKKSNDESSQPKKTVTISITTPGDVKGTILPSTQVAMKDGDTVLDVTQKIAKEKGIQLSVRGSNATAYMEGIDNLYEFDEGPLSGWLIRVDGVLIDRSTGDYPVEPGQSIQWIYTKNYLENGIN